MKRYFVWKDANCNGKNVEWKEITGTEFYALKRAEPHRRFILWKNEDDPMDDGMLYEATEENYKEWDRERKRKEREDKYVLRRLLNSGLITKSEYSKAKDYYRKMTGADIAVC